MRTFADPTKVSTQAQFAEAVKGVAASEVSTRAFAEDGYAGLAEAIQGIDWTGFGGRYLIMITDASSREGGSPLATTASAPSRCGSSPWKTASPPTSST